jgi:hypothetical protein
MAARSDLPRPVPEALVAKLEALGWLPEEIKPLVLFLRWTGPGEVRSVNERYVRFTCSEARRWRWVRGRCVVVDDGDV